MGSRNGWKERAACWESEDPGFFPQGRGRLASNAAKRMNERYCQYCPVRQECAEFGVMVAHGDPGVYAGLTQDERRRLRRRVLAKQRDGVSLV